jgi:DNA-directed RNA polymerase subunit alpha
MIFMIPLPLQPKITEKKGNKAIFEIEALYPGYGLTVGNSLRRVLLSSLTGAAITQVKIQGVQHEFSTIPGVLEDVISILLNLKQLRFKVYSDEPQKATLKIKGEKEVKASDFHLPSQVELINKDYHIATITDKKTELEMEIQIEKGVGYEPVERRKTGSSHSKLPIGTIALDAIYSPVKKVAYRVENMRVGERTDFDKLIIDIETDGTMTPEEAFLQASETLVKHFSLFAESFKKSVPSEEKNPKELAGEEGKEDIAKMKIGDLKISMRTQNALIKNNIKTVGGLLRKSEKSLLELEGMGEKAVKEIQKALKKINLELKE